MKFKNKGTWSKGHQPWNKGASKYSFSPEVESAMVEDYLSGLTHKQVAQKYGYKPCTVYRLLRKKGLMRTNGEAHMGHTTSSQTKAKISNSNKGHPVSTSTRKAVSEANKRRTPEQRRDQIAKSWLTKKLHHTENFSQPEEDLYKELLSLNENKTVYRQYKDPERYPYYCDFYIKEDDLFIELHAHWTHGGHPFDPSDPEDLQKLEVWKERAKTSKFYAQAIYVWTELDPRKKQTAEQHNLNIRIIY